MIQHNQILKTIKQYAEKARNILLLLLIIAVMAPIMLVLAIKDKLEGK